MINKAKFLIIIVFVHISTSYQPSRTSDSSISRFKRSECECVDKHLCDSKTSRIISNGEGIINVRSLNVCPANQVCCKPPESSSTTTEPATTVDPYAGERTFEEFFDEDIRDKPEEGVETIDEVEYVEHTDSSVKLVTESSASKFFLCGARTDAYSQMLKVSGNPDKTETAEGEFPWMLVLNYRLPPSDDQILKSTSGALFLCGASLILPAVAITAAHCIENKKTENLIIRAGDWDLGSDDESYFPEERNVKKVVVHPLYDRYPIKNDLALLILDRAYKSSVAINTICLPHKGLELLWSGCYATGWGAKSQGVAPIGDQTLRKAKLPLVPRDECQQLIRKTKLGARFNLHRSFLCAGGQDDADTCKGDGGGPLACQMKEPPHSFFLVGVTSWGVGCAKKDVPGVYVDVAELSDWINSSVKQLIEENEIPSDSD